MAKSRKEPRSRYHVEAEGEEVCIVDQFGGLLYEDESLRDMSIAARRRLAALHTKDAGMDWEHARDILIAEGLYIEKE